MLIEDHGGPGRGRFSMDGQAGRSSRRSSSRAISAFFFWMGGGKKAAGGHLG